MSSHQVTRQVVAALIRKGDEILLVEEQGRDDSTPHWSVPGGVVEDGELLHEALAREVREETVLESLSIGQLAYIVQFDNPTSHSGHEISGRGFSYTTFVFEIDGWNSDLSDPDPNDVVMRARFLPISDALTKLKALRFTVMRDPLVAYLGGDVEPGTIWLYRRQENGSDKLISKLPQ